MHARRDRPRHAVGEGGDSPEKRAGRTATARRVGRRQGAERCVIEAERDAMALPDRASGRAAVLLRVQLRDSLDLDGDAERQPGGADRRARGG